MNRERLPDRRPSETLTVSHGHAGAEREYAVTVGFDPVTMAPREVFATDAKTGSAMDAIVADACVALSIALQHNVPAQSISRSMSRVDIDPDEPTYGSRPSSIIGAIADLISGIDNVWTA